MVAATKMGGGVGARGSGGSPVDSSTVLSFAVGLSFEDAG